ncbi:hypothetical protein ACTUQ0_15145, partial [Listeria monocytogenes]|uniref:hypothetical protein n=1 Tax=Listeria monocytogenes TaxID=1639 RepID=UPI003FA42711
EPIPVKEVPEAVDPPRPTPIPTPVVEVKPVRSSPVLDDYLLRYQSASGEAADKLIRELYTGSHDFSDELKEILQDTGTNYSMR